jgi:DNA invertase Pin-like site-specific DNA recombinase
MRASLGYKIQTEHLGRRALIYVRQSTLAQVRENVGSKARQYDLVQRALDLGWSREQIVVVDQDQGHSGASAEGRDGFQQLVTEVGLGQAGAVFSLEASRLARSCIDWYRLLEICALTDTLVVDEEGVYDPSQYNDRLLLGFKGTMSEAELHWLHSRLQGGKMKKAESGELWIRLPTGLVYNNTGQVVLDPDEQVQQAIRLLFETFNELGSAGSVVRYFRDHGLRFPTRQVRGADKGELRWGRLGQDRVLRVLHSPLYAGAYVYGRTKLLMESKPGKPRPIKTRIHRSNPEDWDVLILDAHPGYICWEQYLRNQQQLENNRTDRQQGAVREGTALLQGIAICGVCGRRMSVRYRDGITPIYRCRRAYQKYAEPICQTIQGSKIDAHVAQLFLEAMTPAELSISLAAFEQVEARTLQIEQQWHLRIERANYEADLACRRYSAVDPDNRLVARNLERDWNEKLAAVERLERKFATTPRPSVLVACPDERARILDLAQDFQRIWEAATTTYADRKQLLRFLIDNVTLTQTADTIHIGVRWQTGALSELKIPRLNTIYATQRTSTAVIKCIRELASTHTDHQIATILNQEGLTTGAGQAFTNTRVRRVRVKYLIPTSCPEMPTPHLNGQRGDGRYPTQAAAELLNISTATIGNWCKSGKLDCLRSVSGGPRWIKLSPEIIANLRKPVK